MTQIVPNPSISIQPTTVATDIPCRKCGYNLRTLSTDGRCPECGTPIAASLSGDLLAFCDPEWVRLLARGSQLIVGGIIVIFFTCIAVFILAMIKERGLIYLGTFASFGGNLLVVIGSWMITAPDPSGIGEDKYGTVRKVIRVTLLIGLADTLLSMAYRRTMASPDVLLVFNTLQILAAGIGFVGRVAQLQYYEKMAMRIPEPRLSSRAGFLKKVLPASYLLMTILGHLMTQFTPKAKRVPGSAWATFAGLGCFSIIVLLAVMIFAIMYLLMVDKFRKRFSEQAILAGQNWATHVPSPTTPQV